MEVGDPEEENKDACREGELEKSLPSQSMHGTTTNQSCGRRHGCLIEPANGEIVCEGSTTHPTCT